MSDYGSETGSCSCQNNKKFYERIIRQLREKLEHSLLQNGKLEARCALLREQLYISEWCLRSSHRKPFNPNRIPSEVWCEIFSYATTIEGLAFSRWDDKDTTKEWEISSLTRRSIPLVCRIWNVTGTSFLYEHLVVERADQLQQLDTVFNAARAAGIELKYCSWVYALEFAPKPSAKDEGLDYFNLAQQFVQNHPFPHLLTFGIDSNIELAPADKDCIADLAKAALHTYSSQLEHLHLPLAPHDTNWDQIFSVSRSSQVPLKIHSLPRLHSLLMADGKWGYRGSPNMEFYVHLSNISINSLHTLSIQPSPDYNESLFAFLQTVSQLHTLHVRTEIYQNAIKSMPKLFELLPGLRKLILDCSQVWNSPESYNRQLYMYESDIPHPFLSTITIKSARLQSAHFIYEAYALFDAIEKGLFPNLDRVEVQLKGFAGIGSFRSCIDEGEVHQEVNRAVWRHAISTCTKAGVQLVSPSGEPIYLWADKYQVECEDPSRQIWIPPARVQRDYGMELGEDPAGEGEEMILSEDSASNTGIWLEVEEDEDFQGSDAGEESTMSDDSQDPPYRYVCIPDIETVDHDSDSDISDSSR